MLDVVFNNRPIQVCVCVCVCACNACYMGCRVGQTTCASIKKRYGSTFARKVVIVEGRVVTAIRASGYFLSLLFGS